MANRIALAAAGAALSFLTEGVGAETRITPFVDVRQVVTVQSRLPYDAYAELGAGFDAKVERPRLNGQIAYQYGRRVSEHGTLETENRHNLVARLTADISRERFTIDAGAYAGLLNRDSRAGVVFDPSGSDPNLTQTFSGYIEPRYRRTIDGAIDVETSLRVGAASAGGQSARSAGTGIGLPPGAIAADRSARSINEELRVRVGNAISNAGRLRWSVDGEATREHTKRLDQLYRSDRANAGIDYRLARQFGLTGSIGYEDIRSSEDQFLADPVTGLPVPDSNGQLQSNPALPRSVSYARSGLTYQAGFTWTPSRRSLLRLSAGKTYGNFSVNGEARFRFSERLGISAKLEEGIESFGRLLTRDIAGIPSSFLVSDRQASGIGGCVIGTDPATGGCIDNATQSVTSALFRSRTGQVIVSGEQGRTTYAASFTYSGRKFLDSRQLQAGTGAIVDPTIPNRTETSLGTNFNMSRRFGSRSTGSLALFGQRRLSAFANTPADTYAGASVGYARTINRNIDLNLTATADRRFSSQGQSEDRATFTAGLRGRF